MLKLVCLVAVFWLALADDNDDDLVLTSDDINVQIFGRSGGLQFWRGPYNISEAEYLNLTMEVKMESLIEVDSNGIPIGHNKKVKHSFRSFASQDFEFSDLVDGVMPSSSVTAKSITYSGVLKGLSSTMVVTLYILTSSGTISVGGQTRHADEGQIQISTQLSSWQFCTSSTCKKGKKTYVGEFVDFTIEVTPAGNNTSSIQFNQGDETVGFTDGGDIILSNKVEIDGTWQDMPTGYPLYELDDHDEYDDGTEHRFTFRFPKFSTGAVYDSEVDVQDLDISGLEDKEHIDESRIVDDY